MTSTNAYTPLAHANNSQAYTYPALSLALRASVCKNTYAFHIQEYLGVRTGTGVKENWEFKWNGPAGLKSFACFRCVN